MFFRRFAVAESSMSPFLQEGDFIVTRRRPPSVGDVIVFEHPQRPGFHLTKRVVALAGQQVDITGGSVSVDGEAEDAAFSVDDTKPAGEWMVPSESVFVLGDARHRSTEDSRTLGPVFIGPRANVVAFRYWPAGRVGRL